MIGRERPLSWPRPRSLRKPVVTGLFPVGAATAVGLLGAVNQDDSRLQQPRSGASTNPLRTQKTRKDRVRHVSNVGGCSGGWLLTQVVGPKHDEYAMIAV